VSLTRQQLADQLKVKTGDIQEAMGVLGLDIKQNNLSEKEAEAIALIVSGDTPTIQQDQPLLSGKPKPKSNLSRNTVAEIGNVADNASQNVNAHSAHNHQLRQQFFQQNAVEGLILGGQAAEVFSDGVVRGLMAGKQGTIQLLVEAGFKELTQTSSFNPSDYASQVGAKSPNELLSAAQSISTQNSQDIYVQWQSSTAKTRESLLSNQG
jgi:hypothetical protein